MPPAGNAAYRLSTAMRSCGLDSCVVNLSPSAKKDFAFEYTQIVGGIGAKTLNYANRKLQKYRIKKDAYFYSVMPIIGRDIAEMPQVKEADVVYIHWTAGFLTMRNIEKLAQTGKPIFFFMHDMWPFTGGCHHSLNCDKYAKSCEDCKMFEWNNPFPSKQLQEKEHVFSKYPNINFISPSKWMAACAQKSIVMRSKTVYVIPNIVDGRIFKPLDKKIVRDILNLPQDKTIITFGCVAGQGNPFKGWKYLEEAVNKLNLDNILIVVYGSGYNQATVDAVKYPIHFLGRVYDETMLALICNAADVFVTPSLCENYSLAILENVLCRTPVVGFDSTGIPELVKTGVTGYLAKFKDSDDLAHGIEALVNGMPLNSEEWHYSSDEIISMHKDLISKCK